MVLVSRNVPVIDAWQYQPGKHFPTWVRQYLEQRDEELLLKRMSGKQLLLPGEWVVRDLDGDPEWYTSDDFFKTFRVVS